MSSVLSAMRLYYRSNATRSYRFRKQQLLALRQAVVSAEEKIYAALRADLGKSKEECWVTENGFFLAELNETIRMLSFWMKPEPVATNLLNFPSNSRIEREPAGVVLVIGPWNYPFQLLMTPLIGAIAAGNCVVVKPSEHAPATAAVIQEIIDSCFPKQYVYCVQGDGAAVVGDMMRSFAFDHVFYTGSTAVGRKIYQMAAEKLVPVTLELGGKSPCIVEEDAALAVAAKRIVMTKFSNAGQMCVAPDYVLVHRSRKEELLSALQECIRRFFGERPEDAEHYGRIVNRGQLNRLLSYLPGLTVLYGGRYDAEKCFLEPTLVEAATDSAVMQEEIFGPILPVLSFETKEEALEIMRQHPDPLAFYVFTASGKKEREWLDAVPSGGACINNASWHLTNPALPFGGRGSSGMGNYHGRYSFETFSHRKAVMRTPTWFDPSLKYPPFKGKLRIFKWLVR